MEKLKIAIVGCGGIANQKIANQKHMPSIRANAEKAEMVAFCDIIPERAQKAAEEYGTPDAKVYTDYKAMLADHEIEIDVVHVCTPNVAHCPITVAAFEAGKHRLRRGKNQGRNLLLAIKIACVMIHRHFTHPVKIENSEKFILLKHMP